MSQYRSLKPSFLSESRNPGMVLSGGLIGPGWFFTFRERFAHGIGG